MSEGWTQKYCQRPKAHLEQENWLSSQPGSNDMELEIICMTRALGRWDNKVLLIWFADLHIGYIRFWLFDYTKSVAKKLLQFFPLAFQGGLLLHVRHLLCRALDEKLKGMSLSNDMLTEDHYLPTIWELGLERLAKKTTRGIPKVPMNGCRVFLLSHIMLSTRVQKDLFSATSWNHTCWCVFGVSTCWEAT